MEAADPLTSALWTSLGALVPVLPPPRVVPALQRALRDLLAEEPGPGSPAVSASAAHKPVPRRQRPRWVGDLETWVPLRERILAVLAARGLARREFTAEVGISYATLRTSLLPSGRAPGKAVVAQSRRWLEAVEAAADSLPRTGPGANGLDHAEPHVEPAQGGRTDLEIQEGGALPNLTRARAGVRGNGATHGNGRAGR